MIPAMPAVYRLAERTEADGERPEPDTAAEAARVFARSDLRKAS